jgi:hypothetical protein
MRILFQIFILLSLTYTPILAEKMNFVLGLVDEQYNEYKFEDAEIALRKWIKKISKSEDLNLTMKIFDSYEDYNRAVIADEVQSIILSPELYLKHYKSLKETHFDGWIKEANNQFFAYKFVGSKKVYEKKKYLRVSYYKHDSIARIILEQIALRDDKVFIYRELNKESKAVLDTFFNKSDMALISSKVWKLNCELNPQIGEKLQVIDTTDTIFMKMFSLISKKMPAEIKKKYFDTLSRLNESADGRQMMRLFKFNAIYHITTDDLKSLEIFYEKYLKIKREKR